MTKWQWLEQVAAQRVASSSDSFWEINPGWWLLQRVSIAADTNHSDNECADALGEFKRLNDALIAAGATNVEHLGHRYNGDDEWVYVLRFNLPVGFFDAEPVHG